MRVSNIYKVLLMACSLAIGLYLVSCANEKAVEGKAKTPTEGFEQLFNAVRSKDTERIKKSMSESTLKFAEGVAAQRNVALGKILENGLYRSTMTEKLPAIRDERIKDKWGAVEVFVEKDKRWEDVRFVQEDGGWKIAVGELFGGTYVSPGKSRTIRERENANAAGKGMVPYANENGNTNIVPKIITPKKNGRDKK